MYLWCICLSLTSRRSPQGDRYSIYFKPKTLSIAPMYDPLLIHTWHPVTSAHSRSAHVFSLIGPPFYFLSIPLGCHLVHCTPVSGVSLCARPMNCCIIHVVSSSFYLLGQHIQITCSYYMTIVMWCWLLGHSCPSISVRSASTYATTEAWIQSCFTDAQYNPNDCIFGGKVANIPSSDVQMLNSHSGRRLDNVVFG